MPTPEVKQSKKTKEQISLQIGRIAGKLVERAAKAGAGQALNPIKYDRGGYKVDTGKVDSTGRKVIQEIASSDGRYDPSGPNVALTRGAGTIDGVNMITAYENGTITAGPDGSNPRGFSLEELTTEAATQLGGFRSKVAAVEIQNKALFNEASPVATIESASTAPSDSAPTSTSS
jgi:hypothetical protein